MKNYRKFSGKQPINYIISLSSYKFFRIKNVKKKIWDLSAKNS